MAARTRSRSRYIGFAWAFIIGLALLSVGYALWNQPSTTPAARITALEKEIRCPSCGGLPVYDSKSASAYSIADYIQREVRAGQSNQQIVDALVASYGDTILLAPPASGVGLFLWLLPLGVAAVLGYELLRSLRDPGRRRSEPTASSPVAQPALGEFEAGSTPVQAYRLGEEAAGPRGTGSGAIVARLPRVPKRIAQVGAAMVLVGAGALGTLLVTGGGSSPRPSLEAQLASAEALAGLGAVNQARQEFQKVLETYPANPTALAYTGWIDFNLAKTRAAKAQAVTELAQAVAAGPGNASAQLYYGLALFYGEDRPALAIDHLGQFLSSHPSASLVKQAYRLAKPIYKAAGRKIPPSF